MRRDFDRRHPHASPHWYLCHLAVLPDHRHQGIGTAHAAAPTATKPGRPRIGALRTHTAVVRITRGSGLR
ncbi:GNAT family N-acetyltransferase [Nocardia sp. NPDC051570]|uniref:GNAT family N-acetyltransferase n=1 Tax=Nocardia sp. NPDC051570 TaxID=3364324 RepID=UPI0037AAF0C3